MLMKTLLLVIFASFLIVVLIAPLFIPFLRRLKFGQSIRGEGPSSHQKKAGTPTMGGIVILLAVAIVTFQFSNVSPVYYLLIFVTLGFGLIGFLDDFIKIYFKRNLGLTTKQKLLGQFVIALLFYYSLYVSGHSTEVSVPGIAWSFDLGWLYFPFVLIMLVGASNAVNLTDGLDGLLSGTAAIAFSAYMILAFQFMQMEVAIFSGAIVGAVLGFLVYNAYPAKVFMGDTGSLALGGAIAAIAILTKTELLLVIIGGVFVIETLSVIMQVFFFKIKGKRIFRMSPIHHHFELSGWSEWKVVTIFWCAALIFAGIGIYVEVFVNG